MKANKAATFTSALLSGVLASGSSLAIDAGEVMDKMQPGERSGFIAGAVDMAAHLYAVNGNEEKADCAVTWLFDDENALREVFGLFDAHKDKDAVGLLSILIDRRCGK